ncbi:MAG: hypothetical protein JNJ57_20105 [Saprospiraceae bacterium]|nr:hypothetical protein [Saprospiraceae bacterium]
MNIPSTLPTTKTLVFCFMLATGFTQRLSAQITIDNSVFPVVGDTLHFAFGNQPGAINQIYTPPGFGQQWNLSNLQPTHFWNQVFKNPQTGAASANFPGASLLYHPYNSDNQVYLHVSGTQVLNMGYFGLDELGLGLNLLFKNVPALEDSWAPINFFDLHQSASNVLTAFDAPIAPPVLLNLVPTADSFRIRVSYQRVSAIDATGTMSIPGGTFEVLRKKQTEYKSTAVDVKVAPLGWIDISTIGGQQLLPLGTDTSTTFHFLNNVSKEPIAICTLNTAQNTVTSVQYKAVSPTTGTDDIAKDQAQFGLFPNPAQHAVTLQWELQKAADVRIVLFDETGRQLHTLLEETMAAGLQTIDLALPKTQPGLYFVGLLADGVLKYRTKLLIYRD